LALLAFWAPAAAETAGAGVTAYPAGFFAQAELSTAFDMIGRLPGFAFDDGDGARGFAGTAGNVLIDGSRPTAKTDDLEAILKRIPASRVARIDVIRGGAPGIDMQGKSVIANVILADGDGVDILMTAQTIYWGGGAFQPSAILELTGRDGPRTFEATITRYADVNDDAVGKGYFRSTPAAGPATSGTSRISGGKWVGWGFHGAGTSPLLGGEAGANLTLKQTINSESVAYGAPLSATYLDRETSAPMELGLNWEKRSGASDLVILAVARLEHDKSFNTGDDPSGAQLFTASQDVSETILRATWSYNWSDALTFETGGEGAYNSLYGRSDYRLNGAEIALPGSTARVGERRGEAFAQGTWKFTGGSLEAGTRFEASRISALGVPSRVFSFLKPRLLLSLSPFDNVQLRVRAERVVGQLDFSNFVASSNLSGNGVAGGNSAIRPDRRWQFEGVADWRFWEKGDLSISFMHEAIADLVDFIPIGGRLDAPGNIPSAANDEIRFNLSLPTQAIAWDGGLLTAAFQWDSSAVTDPFTGLTRAISNKRDRKLNLSYTQDAPAWNSTFELSVIPVGFSQTAFRIAQVSDFRLRAPYLSLTWTYKPEPGLELTMEGDNIVPYHWRREQDNFAGPRGVSALGSVLLAGYTTQPRLMVRLKKTL
jgi:hypothetical protein